MAIIVKQQQQQTDLYNISKVTNSMGVLCYDYEETCRSLPSFAHSGWTPHTGSNPTLSDISVKTLAPNVPYPELSLTSEHQYLSVTYLCGLTALSLSLLPFFSSMIRRIQESLIKLLEVRRKQVKKQKSDVDVVRTELYAL